MTFITTIVKIEKFLIEKSLLEVLSRKLKVSQIANTKVKAKPMYFISFNAGGKVSKTLKFNPVQYKELKIIKTSNENMTPEKPSSKYFFITKSLIAK